jgi:hypothetical protein
LFATSKNKPETDDVVLWSNGGPGCSSLFGKKLSLFRFSLGSRPTSTRRRRTKSGPIEEPLLLEQQSQHAFLLEPSRCGIFNKQRSKLYS